MARYEDAVGASKAEDRISRTVSILACIHGADNGGIYGKLVNFYLREPVEFAGVGELVLKADLICDWLDGQEQKIEGPFLNNEMKRKFRKKYNEDAKVSVDCLLNWQGNPAYSEATHAKEVLIISIDFRRNFSMQGRVRGRLTGGRYVCFRSALELLRMLNMIEIS